MRTFLISMIIFFLIHTVRCQKPDTVTYDKNVPNSAPNSAMDNKPTSKDEDLGTIEKELMESTTTPSPAKESVTTQRYFRQCYYCVCSKERGAHGTSYIAMCYSCKGSSKCWHRCYNCYCSRQYNYYYSYRGFCSRCY